VFKNPHHRLQCTFSALLAIVRVALLRSSWRSCFMRAALFIMRATNSSLVFAFSLQTSLFIHPHRQKSDLYAATSNSCIFTPNENGTHVYMNLFTRNSPCYHLLKYLLFLLKHPVYIYTHTHTHIYIHTRALARARAHTHTHTYIMLLSNINVENHTFSKKQYMYLQYTNNYNKIVQGKYHPATCHEETEVD